ncbi:MULTISPECIES: C-terminal binding protein [unclassified Chelatococcus]|uniref:C-terminal binding protein n=1 Tax=unclassified Chelatococcus TaxID=2638111 RepID=UPI001BD16D93|nr:MULTISPECIES: C-terminal binding protein [unclassified Chelatococcus]CAH1654634.1 C-terminal binding protein [Hyphomicrobiales bacterium]MBS7742763.1 C-terminal binding protein [Chelatococcus sp. HY11]MBX3542119.1 C-terminal binding protein [Chelatococcus sp.]MCO5075666.1 C-terminal binding protein [Chelatococcus sp.]CAH1694990.1 C-terminal binding protein [Hyphomicrobiales bacterium]
MHRIAIIDPQFADTPDIEQSVAGKETLFDIIRPGNGAVPAAALHNADAIVNCRSRHLLPAPLITQMERAKIVVQAGVGFNHIDIEACAARGIPVCNTPDYGTMEVADHAIALMLSLIRGVTAYNNRLMTRDDAWSTLSLPLPPVRRLAGQMLGIVGLGRIGTATALRARAFNMDVAFFDPGVPAGQELALGLRRVDHLEDLLGMADVVSLHCPLTTQTERLIDDRAIARMRPGSVLINTARGGIVDLDAVERGLRSDRLCAAALDVLPREPLDRRHPLIAAWTAAEPWLEGRLILTPHAAFYTPESLADMRRLAMVAAVDFLREGRLRSCVNLRELDRHGYAFAA